MAEQSKGGRPRSERQERQRAAELRGLKVKPSLTFLWPLGTERQAALELLAKPNPTLEEVKPFLSSKDDLVIGAGLHVLTSLPRGALQEVMPLLHSLRGHRSTFVYSAVADLIRAKDQEAGYIEKHVPLNPAAVAPLLSRKPAYETHYPQELNAHLARVDVAVRECMKKFGSKFVGVTVFGSAAKGYWRLGSDIDVAVIASSKRAVKHFEKIVDRRVVKHYAHWVEPGKGENYGVNPRLFYGLFLGNRRALEKIQRETIGRARPVEWLSVQEHINGVELDGLWRLVHERFGGEATQNIAVGLLRVPPNLEEIRRIKGIGQAPSPSSGGFWRTAAKLVFRR